MSVFTLKGNPTKERDQTTGAPGAAPSGEGKFPDKGAKADWPLDWPKDGMTDGGIIRR